MRIHTPMCASTHPCAHPHPCAYPHTHTDTLKITPCVLIVRVPVQFNGQHGEKGNPRFSSSSKAVFEEVVKHPRLVFATIETTSYFRSVGAHVGEQPFSRFSSAAQHKNGNPWFSTFKRLFQGKPIVLWLGGSLSSTSKCFVNNYF